MSHQDGGHGWAWLDETEIGLLWDLVAVPRGFAVQKTRWRFESSFEVAGFEAESLRDFVLELGYHRGVGCKPRDRVVRAAGRAWPSKYHSGT